MTSSTSSVFSSLPTNVQPRPRCRRRRSCQLVNHIDLINFRRDDLGDFGDFGDLVDLAKVLVDLNDLAEDVSIINVGKPIGRPCRSCRQLAEEQEGVYYANKQANHDYWAQENRISNDPEIR